MNSITTSTGTTISTEPSNEGPLVILDNPDAPNDMRLREAGRIVGGGFQPEPNAPWAMSPETLRAIADLIDATHQAALEPARGHIATDWERAAFDLGQQIRPHLHAVPDTTTEENHA